MATQFQYVSHRGPHLPLATVSAVIMRCLLSGPRMSIVLGNCIRYTLLKKGNKIVQEIMRKYSKCFRFYAVR